MGDAHLKKENNNLLIIFIRGWTRWGCIPESYIDYVKNIYKQKYYNVDIFYPNLDMGTFSIANPNDIIRDLCRKIDGLVADKKYNEVIFISYSAGTLIGRGLFLEAWGMRNVYSPICIHNLSWAPKIKKIIYLSGIHRGWDFSSATPLLERIFGPSMHGAWYLLSFGYSFLSKCQRGNGFIIDLCLRHLELDKYISANKIKPPDYIYVLGTCDEFVSPIDSIDIDIRSGPIFIEIPNTNHLEIITTSEKDTHTQRKECMNKILTMSGDDLKEISINSDDLDDYIDPLDQSFIISQKENNELIKEIVIIIHGIRDNGFWTKRIGRKIKESHNRLYIRTPTPSYGFFSILLFANYFSREAKTRWFMEQYANIRILYPNAKISVAAHSNGTYLVANAINRCKSIVFDKIYFAGSVVRTDYDWLGHTQQYNKVLNIVHGKDYIVGLAPAMMEIFRLKFMNLGGAGYLGFRSAISSQENDLNPPETDSEAGKIINCYFNEGGHGAGVSEDKWDSIVDYFVKDTIPKGDCETNKIKLYIIERYARIFIAYLLIIFSFFMLYQVGSFIYSSYFHNFIYIITPILGWLLWRFIKSC